MISLSWLGSSCTSNCVQLAQKICDCQTTQQDRDNCNSQASARSDQVHPTEADEKTCGELIDKCNCYELDTPQGKVNCGLARPPTN